MNRQILGLISSLLVIVLAAACSLPTPPTPTVEPSPTVLPSLTLAPSPTMEASPTFIPTATATPTATESPTATTTPTSTPEPVSDVTFYLVALEDEGQSGIPIGCGDSLVEVTQPAESDGEPILAALERLFSFKTQFVGESGLYTALWQSDLVVDTVTIQPDGTAQVALTGEYLLGGVCDNPRFQGQIEETILAAPGVTDVQVTLNGQPLEEQLSGQ